MSPITPARDAFIYRCSRASYFCADPCADPLRSPFSRLSHSCSTRLTAAFLLAPTMKSRHMCTWGSRSGALPAPVGGARWEGNLERTVISSPSGPAATDSPPAVCPLSLRKNHRRYPSSNGIDIDTMDLPRFGGHSMVSGARAPERGPQWGRHARRIHGSSEWKRFVWRGNLASRAPGLRAISGFRSRPSTHG